MGRRLQASLQLISYNSLCTIPKQREENINKLMWKSIVANCQPLPTHRDNRGEWINHRHKIRNGPTQHSKSQCSRSHTHTHKLGWIWVAARARHASSDNSPFLCAFHHEFLVGGDELEFGSMFPNTLQSLPHWSHGFVLFIELTVCLIPSRSDATPSQILSLEKFSKVSVQNRLLCIHWCLRGLQSGRGKEKTRRSLAIKTLVWRIADQHDGTTC